MNPYQPPLCLSVKWSLCENEKFASSTATMKFVGYNKWYVSRLTSKIFGNKTVCVISADGFKAEKTNLVRSKLAELLFSRLGDGRVLAIITGEIVDLKP